MKVLIDIGNQRLKWATSDQIDASIRVAIASQVAPDEMRLDKIMGDQIINTDSTAQFDQLAMQFKKLPVPESVWVSCVSAEAIKKRIVEVCQTIWQLSPTCICAQADAVGVENGYDNPATLGVDRWAADVGARYIIGHTARGESLVVIDAGTAVTIDYISREGRLLGGIIFPGVATMIKSLNLATSQIKEMTPLTPLKDTRKQIQLMNTNTQSALENGVMLAVVAGIDQAIDQYLHTTDGELKIIITGGDAECIASLSIHDIKHEENLVLIGLLLLSEEAQ